MPKVSCTSEDYRVGLADDADYSANVLHKDGSDPKRPAVSDAFEDVVANFTDSRAKVNTRTWAQTERVFRTYVLSEWRDRNIHDIKRRDLSALLDRIARGARRACYFASRRRTGGTCKGRGWSSPAFGKS